MFMKGVLGIRQQLFTNRLHCCLTVMLFCQNSASMMLMLLSGNSQLVVR